MHSRNTSIIFLLTACLLAVFCVSPGEAKCHDIQKKNFRSITGLFTVNDKRQFPIKTSVNAPISVLSADAAKPMDDFGSCAAHCMAYSATGMLRALGKIDSYISVNEMEKLQFTCEGMCRNGLYSSTFVISVRTK